MVNMSEKDVPPQKDRDNRALIIAVAVVVLVIIFMYLRDRQQQHAFEMRSLEKRVEFLEDWGMPRQ